MIGNPRDPGGTLFNDLLLRTRRRNTGSRNRKIVAIMFMIEGTKVVSLGSRSNLYNLLVLLTLFVSGKASLFHYGIL